MSRQQAIAHPRILVCCPSNAAVDELVARLLRQQFRDGTGNSYAPPLVRIGEASGGKLSDEAKRISADCRSLYLLAMPEQDRIFHGSNMKRQVQMLEHEMHAVISNVILGLDVYGRTCAASLSLSLSLSLSFFVRLF